MEADINLLTTNLSSAPGGWGMSDEAFEWITFAMTVSAKCVLNNLILDTKC